MWIVDVWMEFSSGRRIFVFCCRFCCYFVSFIWKEKSTGRSVGFLFDPSGSRSGTSVYPRVDTCGFVRTWVPTFTERYAIADARLYTRREHCANTDHRPWVAEQWVARRRGASGRRAAPRPLRRTGGTAFRSSLSTEDGWDMGCTDFRWFCPGLFRLIILRVVANFIEGTV